MIAQMCSLLLPQQLRLEGVFAISHINRKNPEAAFLSPPEMLRLGDETGPHPKITNSLYYWISDIPIGEKHNLLPIPKGGISCIPLTLPELAQLPCQDGEDALINVAVVVIMSRHSRDARTGTACIALCNIYDVGNSGLPGVPCPPGGSRIQPHASHGALFFQQYLELGQVTHIKSNGSGHTKAGAGCLPGLTCTAALVVAAMTAAISEQSS